MVIHDETRIHAWTQQTEKQHRERKRHQWSVSVIAVQSIACCVILLLALLLRVAGGDAYDILCREFEQALARNELMTALSRVWDDKPLENIEIIDKTDVKVDNFTSDKTALLIGSSDMPNAMPLLENGTLTSLYGKRIHPINGGEEFHSGVDIAAPTGSELMAVYDGVVAEVGENNGLGRYVRLNYGEGVEMLYGHCDRVTVKQGDAVTAGSTVALVGSTGVSTGSHVHLTVLVDGAVCDPAAFVSLERYA